MNIQAEKRQLIAWMTELNDPAILAQLKAFKKANEEGWWDLVSDTEKLAIEQGIAELDAGHGISHDEVMCEVKAKLQAE
jgi:hypothetical protein